MLINKQRYKVGRVLSNGSDKTIKVVIHYKTIHPVYGKFLKRMTKLMAHDQDNLCNVGDLVRIMEVRPLSRKKRWKLVNIVGKVR